MKRLLVNLIYAALFTALSFMPSDAFADATAFDPVPVQIKAGGAGLPVGTVISWPAAVNPPDAGNWLDCDGRAISRTAYPELYAIVGSKVPDYRGLFLRGVGGAAADLGVRQEESVYVDPARAKMSMGGFLAGMSGDSVGHSGGYVLFNYVIATGHGARDLESGRITGDPTSYLNNGSMINNIPFELSMSGSEQETRPVNMAVRYLIRARP